MFKTAKPIGSSFRAAAGRPTGASVGSRLLALLIGASAWAPTFAEPATDTEAAAPLTVAVLGFEAVGAAAPGWTVPPPGAPQAATPPPAGGEGLSVLMNDVLQAMVSGQGDLALVDRAELNRTLDEQAVNLSGVTDTQRAVAIGRVVGAQLLVTGKAFELGESRIVTAKVIGSETTLTRSVMVRATLDEPLDAMVFEAAEKMVELLNQHGRELVAGAAPQDPIPALVAALKKRDDLPVMAVVIPEEHIRAPVRIAVGTLVVPDPAVETELKSILIDAGVDVRDVKDNALADWVNDFESGAGTAWPRSLEGVDWVIVGEAFSQGAGVMGQLQFASARAEINVIQRKDGRIVRADRVTTRGVDLAEQIAGKTALEKAGRQLAQGLLRQMIEAP